MLTKALRRARRPGAPFAAGRRAEVVPPYTAVVLSAGTDAVPAPVPQGPDNFMQHWITGVDRPALAGCDVVGGIEAGGPNVSNSPCLTPCPVYVILSAQGITVVLYKPQLIFIAEGFYPFKSLFNISRYAE